METNKEIKERENKNEPYGSNLEGGFVAVGGFGQEAYLTHIVQQMNRLSKFLATTT